MAGALAGALGSPVPQEWAETVAEASRLDLTAPARTLAEVAREMFTRDVARRRAHEAAFEALRAGTPHGTASTEPLDGTLRQAASTRPLTRASHEATPTEPLDGTSPESASAERLGRTPHAPASAGLLDGAGG
jgi:hypothetical protein